MVRICDDVDFVISEADDGETEVKRSSIVNDGTAAIVGAVDVDDMTGDFDEIGDNTCEDDCSCVVCADVSD